MKQKINKYQIVTIGGATADIMFYSGEGELINTGNLTKQKLLAFEYGAKILANQLYHTYGGGAANTAIAFAKLGLRTACICRVGNDANGKKIIENLKNNRVDTGLIGLDSKNATGFSMILTVNNAAKEHIVFAYRGANNWLSLKDFFPYKIKTDWFYISSLPKNSWEGIIKTLLNQKSHLAWNPGNQQLAEISKIKKYLPKIQLLLLNRDEALEFRKLKEIKDLIKYIRQLGPKIVVITDGKNGAYVYDGKKYYFMKARSSKNIDTVGVGDAFSSGFIAALIYGKNIKDGLRWGINNSASVVAKIGAQNGLLNLRQIRK